MRYFAEASVAIFEKCQPEEFKGELHGVVLCRRIKLPLSRLALPRARRESAGGDQFRLISLDLCCLYLAVYILRLVQRS